MNTRYLENTYLIFMLMAMGAAGAVAYMFFADTDQRFLPALVTICVGATLFNIRLGVQLAIIGAKKT